MSVCCVFSLPRLWAFLRQPFNEKWQDKTLKQRLSGLSRRGHVIQNQEGGHSFRNCRTNQSNKGNCRSCFSRLDKRWKRQHFAYFYRCTVLLVIFLNVDFGTASTMSSKPQQRMFRHLYLFFSTFEFFPWLYLCEVPLKLQYVDCTLVNKKTNSYYSIPDIILARDMRLGRFKDAEGAGKRLWCRSREITGPHANLCWWFM